MSYPAYTPPGAYDKQDDKIELGAKYYEDDCCSCGENGMFSKFDNWLAFGVGLGGLTMMVSTFIPLWRLDIHGTTELETYWDLGSISGFDTRSYGLIHVKGSWSQSWTTLAQSSCDIRNIGQLTNMVSAAWESLTHVTSGFDCGDKSCCSENGLCQAQFAQSMHTRCVEYEKMMRVSMVTLMANFVACLMIAAGCTVFGLSKRKRTGGVAFGLWTFAGMLSMIMGTVWAFVSDNAFKNLSTTAWYPYPSLSVSYYMHVAGYATVLTSTAIFGFMVLPDVWKFDPAQDKLDKLQRKMDRKKNKEQTHQKKKDELQRFIAGQQGMQPGYGAYAPQPAPYGQVAPVGGYGQPGYVQPGPRGPAPPQPVPMQQSQLKGGQGVMPGQVSGAVQTGYAVPPQGQGNLGNAPPMQVPVGNEFGLAPALGGQGETWNKMPAPQGNPQSGGSGPGYGSGQPNLSSMPPGMNSGQQNGPSYGNGQPNLSSMPPGVNGPSYGGGQPNVSSMPPGVGGTGPSYGGGQPNVSSMPPGMQPGQQPPGGQMGAKRPQGPGSGGYNWPAFQGEEGETWNKMPSPPPSQGAQ